MGLTLGHTTRRFPWLRSLAALLLLGSLRPGAVAGATIEVPGDQPTVRAAVSAAASGDTVLIAPGTHAGGVFVNHKVLVLGSRYLVTGDTAWVAQTILSGVSGNVCGGAPGCAGNAVLEYGSNADGNRIVGLTLTNGENGVASSATVDISHCRIIGNGDGVDYVGGAGGTFDHSVFAFNSDDGIDLNGHMALRVLDNRIEDNLDDGIEYRLHAYTGPTLAVDVRRNLITGNGEDGIQLIDYDGAANIVVRIYHNLFRANFDGSGSSAGVGCMANGNTVENLSGAPIVERVYLINNTFVDERNGFVGGANVIALNNVFTRIQASALRRVAGGSIASHCLFWNNGTDYEASNVDLPNLLHVDPALAADGSLTPASPAIDAGTDVFTWQGNTVLYIPPENYLGIAPDLGALEALPEGIAERRIAAAADDAEEAAGGQISSGTGSLQLVRDQTDQTVGLRFSNLAIPRGATILAAHVQFVASQVQSDPTSLVFQGEASDHALAFGLGLADISSRPRTAAAVAWAPPPWGQIGESGPGQATPNLAAVVQEIVDRPGWGSGNALALIVTGTGRRTAVSYEASPATAALLQVVFGTPVVDVPPPAPPPSPGLSLRPLGPQPSAGTLRLELGLADRRPALLALFDVAGRQVAAREVGSLGPGRHSVDLGGAFPSGLYLARLSQGPRAAVLRVVVLR